MYSTVTNLLDHIFSAHTDFPLQLETTLWRYMKWLGFYYKQTSKVVVPLDSATLVAPRVVYFRYLGDLRNNSTAFYYHDETWCSISEEKRTIWLDEKDNGCFRKTDGKSKQLAISITTKETIFHKESIDIFTNDNDHSMNSTQLISSPGSVVLPLIFTVPPLVSLLLLTILRSAISSYTMLGHQNARGVKINFSDGLMNTVSDMVSYYKSMNCSKSLLPIFFPSAIKSMLILMFSMLRSFVL